MVVFGGNAVGLRIAKEGIGGGEGSRRDVGCCIIIGTFGCKANVTGIMVLCGGCRETVLLGCQECEVSDRGLFVACRS